MQSIPHLLSNPHLHSLSWFNSYLENRSHCMLANKGNSKEIKVEYGVPQGSILGPLLFSVYVNELPDCVSNSSVLLYADDAVILTEGYSGAEISIRAKPDLDNIFEWASINWLTINGKQTKQVVYGTQPRLDRGHCQSHH